MPVVRSANYNATAVYPRHSSRPIRAVRLRCHPWYRDYQPSKLAASLLAPDDAQVSEPDRDGEIDTDTESTPSTPTPRSPRSRRNASPVPYPPISPSVGHTGEDSDDDMSFGSNTPTPRTANTRSYSTAPSTPTPLGNSRGLQRSYAMILSPSIPDSEELDEPSTPSPLLSDIVSDERDTPYGTGSDWDMDSNAISADEGTGRRDIRRFKVDDIGFDQFDPDTLAESDESLLWKLDSFADAGLLYADLCVVFVQCGKCKALTALRNIHYHQCQLVLSTPRFAPLDRVSLLYCSRTEGIRHESFEDLMSFCGLCQRFMTHRAALLHDCELDRLLQLSLNTTV